MQERGDRNDSDENEDFLGDGAPEPVNLGEAARLASNQRAQDDLQDELRAEAWVRAEVHHRSSSSGATGATSRH
jgi:hypothetical protein